MSKGLIVHSSKTGNTRRVAERIQQGLTEQGIFTDMISASDVTDATDVQNYEWILWGFWVDRGTANKEALKALANISGKPIGTFGTLGAYPDSDHANKVRVAIKELVEEHNTYLGEFLCMGKIDPLLTERFKQLPKDHPHAMNEARIKRHAEAAKHPNEADFTAAIGAVQAMLAPVAGVTNCAN